MCLLISYPYKVVYLPIETTRALSLFSFSSPHFTLHTVFFPFFRWTWLWSKSQTLSTTGTSWGWRLRGRAIMTSPPLRVATAFRPWRRGSSTAMRGQLVSMADLWILMMSEVPLMSSLTGGEGREEKRKWNLRPVLQIKFNIPKISFS